MDVFLKSCRNSGFVQVSNSLGKPIVVHCVPGAGKSTLIRNLIQCDSRFEAFTYGVKDPVDLKGRRIRGAEELKEDSSCKFILIDEYTAASALPNNCFAIFGDPVQKEGVFGFSADFVNIKTRRFGAATCRFLKGLQFDIESDLEDTLNIQTPQNCDIIGTIIAVGPEATALCCHYRLDYKTAEQVRGSTFEEVTVITDFGEVEPNLRSDFYVACTRHRKKLNIVSPDEITSSS